MNTQPDVHGESVLPTCSVEHPTIGPCDLRADHRGAHRVTRVVARHEHHYFGTSELGDPVTAAGAAILSPATVVSLRSAIRYGMDGGESAAVDVLRVVDQALASMLLSTEEPESQGLGGRIAESYHRYQYGDAGTHDTLMEAALVASAIVADLGVEPVLTGRTGLYEEEVTGRTVLGESDVWGRRIPVYRLRGVDDPAPTSRAQETP